MRNDHHQGAAAGAHRGGPPPAGGLLRLAGRRPRAPEPGGLARSLADTPESAWPLPHLVAQAEATVAAEQIVSMAKAEAALFVHQGELATELLDRAWMGVE
jgi:hypothetical protein